MHAVLAAPNVGERFLGISNQTDAIALLTDIGKPGVSESVEIIDTHISRIILAGDCAFKIKRAVKLPYVDFSTPKLRLAACLKEVEFNSITAPGLYVGVRRIVRNMQGRLTLDGDGELVEAVIEMKRFDQSLLLDRMAAVGKLTPELMTQTARTIARFHSQAPAVHSGSGSENLASVLDINKAGFATSHCFREEEVTILDGVFRETLSQHADVMNQREVGGKVRRCHGDLHLRNICLLDGQPCLFDCIEFNDQIATVDVLYDLAFLLMDLRHRGFPELANLVMNRYLDETDNEDGFALLPFLMAIRAAVRAHVTGTQIEESGDLSGCLRAEARAYFDLAMELLEKRPPRLIAIGGLSGSGKTTIAEALAAHIGAPPGARIVESDRIRKALHGVPPETRLPEEAYRPEVSDRVYGEMVWRAELILAGGGTVLADAVFDRPADRTRIEKVAMEQHVPFIGIWLDVSPDVLWRRVDQRRGGPSDATVDILSRQLKRNAGEITWRRFDADRSPADILSGILAAPIN
ncbi:aminoglycoside phosphotransferase [Brucella anthropi]|uniref:bifunctional aminoglycoside phosphotransferase/ATP-binding protein n=1 Tax=Brucella anthropi TaxID=529 RepID=UPI000DEC9E17|nr:aminoglycoside phosphotransferase [Brucella anthropi]